MNAGTNEQFSQTSKVILFFFLFSEKYFFNNSTIITYNIWIRSEFYSDRLGLFYKGWPPCNLFHLDLVRRGTLVHTQSVGYLKYLVYLFKGDIHGFTFEIKAIITPIFVSEIVLNNNLSFFSWHVVSLNLCY